MTPEEHNKMSNRKFCPECIKEGKKSSINIGPRFSTSMNIIEYYDENGYYHFENPNIITTHFSCSNGHNWTETNK